MSASTRRANERAVLELDKLVRNARASVEEVYRKAAFDLTSAIVFRTPVDTGRLRGNWQTQLGSAPDGEIEGTDSAGHGTLGKANGVIFSAQLSDSIFVVNNLPYAEVVEYGLYPNPPKRGTKTIGGYSKQAPAGMVRVSIREFTAFIEAAAAKVRR